MQLRWTTIALAFALAACGGRSSSSTLSKPAPAITPAADLAEATSKAPKADPTDASAVAKDPRVIDLDIIRIKASPSGVGGEPELTSVASADLFTLATEAAKAGRTQAAIAQYRQLLAEFPDSKYAPLSMLNIAAILDGQGDIPATITTLRELVTRYPTSRESIDGHLYIVALQADKQQWADALVTLEAILARPNLTYADRIEAYARKGYVQLEQQQLDAADATLALAVAEWRKAPRIEDPYYIAMAHYYRGEVAHRRFELAPVRLPDDRMVADLEAKRVLAVQAYDRWREALGFKHAYWATASGYQMSQIFMELWEAHVKAPYPARVDTAARPTYVVEVHERVREHLAKALEGHRMNVELAKAFGVDTAWSKGSEQRAMQLMQLLAKDQAGQFETPAN
ncbi:MAG: tetratricopeptide repeat protein [Kofleriaceae bacterium]|nr:tetratricopeptide repeat protein [Kofleriaceae bacterium]